MPKRSRSTRSKSVRKAIKKWKRNKSVVTKGINEQNVLGLSMMSINHRVVPRVTKACLRYHTAVTLNPGVAGIASTQIIGSNALYDPDISGVGHQPMGFDQYMLLYRSGLVYKSVISVFFVNLDTAIATGTNVVGISLYSSSDSAAGEISEKLIENGNCVFDYLTATTLTSKNTTSLSYTFYHGKHFGTKLELDDREYWNQAGANPNQIGWFNVWCANGVGSDVQGVQAFITVDYYTLFCQPNEITQS